MDKNTKSLACFLYRQAKQMNKKELQNVLFFSEESTEMSEVAEEPAEESVEEENTDAQEPEGDEDGSDEPAPASNDGGAKKF